LAERGRHRFLSDVRAVLVADAPASRDPFNSLSVLGIEGLAGRGVAAPDRVGEGSILLSLSHLRILNILTTALDRNTYKLSVLNITKDLRGVDNEAMEWKEARCRLEI